MATTRVNGCNRNPFAPVGGPVGGVHYSGLSVNRLRVSNSGV